MESTWKVATRPRKGRSDQQSANPKPKKQPKTQTATPESRNLRQGKGRNLNFCSHSQKSHLAKKPKVFSTKAKKYKNAYVSFMQSR